jgi:hypothetical protein
MVLTNRIISIGYAQLFKGNVLRIEGYIIKEQNFIHSK